MYSWSLFTVLVFQVGVVVCRPWRCALLHSGLVCFVFSVRRRLITMIQLPPVKVYELSTLFTVISIGNECSVLGVLSTVSSVVSPLV